MYGGQQEFVFPDSTRCDCLLSNVAVEFDFGDKWYEAVGQSLYYGMWARRTPAIALILEDYDSDTRSFYRLMQTIHEYGLNIRVFPIFLDATGQPYEMWP